METDTSEESRKNHMAYYKSLNRTISEIRREMGSENDPTIKNHLEGRVDAMEQDLDRIRKMFPDVTRRNGMRNDDAPSPLRCMCETQDAVL